MSLIAAIKRFLLLFNIMTLITILSYLYAFNMRMNGSEEKVIPLTLKPSSVKRQTYKKDVNLKHTNQKFSNATNIYTTVLNGKVFDLDNINSSLKLAMGVGNSTEPNIEYYGDEDSTKTTATIATTSTTSTTTTTSTSTTTTSTTTITTTTTLKSSKFILLVEFYVKVFLNTE